ncbi:MAG: Na+:solute symporter [bacterium]|nr:Na+:solute symporter [bacterium]
MQLNNLDWIVIAGCLIVAFSPALYFARRAGKGTAEFFVSGRAAPWWLIGTSMVATTFSTDTPNLVTDFVRDGGVAKNWVWWAFLLTGMATVFFYSRLWRRSGVLTDLEFYELRYAGRPAAWVRGFRSIYLGLFFNCVIMGTVTLAAVKIANVMLGWDRLTTVIVCAVLCIGFSVLSGLWGVLASDIIQFVIAMVGVVAAAYYALDAPEVGGLAGLMEKIDPATLRLLPDFGDWSLVIPVLIIPLTIQWWSVWYPGSEPGGGSYVAQRVLAARDERHAMAATLWYNIAHYALRPWPWILVALCSLLVFPTLGDITAALPNISPELLGNDIAYPAMLTLLPHGLLGLLIASLLSAYVSTMSTHLNWGASYLVHDLYRRFLRPGAGERHYVLVSRLVTAGLMIVAAMVTFVIDTAGEGFHLLLSIGAGTGLIYLLRWFWWRINAWSEVWAMASSFGITAVIFGINKALAGGMEPGRIGYRLADRGLLQLDGDVLQIADHTTLIATVAVTTVVWWVATLVTRPVPDETLKSFYRLVRPAGPGWRRIREATGVGASPDSLPQAFLGWVLGCALVYAALFGTGSFIYGNVGAGAVWAVIFAGSFAGLAVLLSRMWGRSRVPTPTEVPR